MAYASLPDIQTWLARDKIPVDDANSKGPLIDAERLIRGQLASVFPILTLSSWTEPDNTPEIVRGIAGRLTAAFIYRDVYSEEVPDVPEYAKELYTEAIAILAGIKDGTIQVIGTDDTIIGDETGGMLSFWPDATVEPKFTMDQEFA